MSALCSEKNNLYQKTTGFSYNITLVSQDLKCYVKLNIIYKVLYTQTNTIVRNRMPTKSNEKWKSFLHCICKYLLFHSALSKKKYFCHKFSIFNKFTHPPPSLTITTTTTLLHSCNGQNLISMAKVFCWCSLSMNSVYDFWDTIISHRFLEPFWWNKSVWKEGWTLYAKFLTCVTCYNHI